MEPLLNPETPPPFCLQMQRVHCINKFKMLHSIYKYDDSYLFTNTATPFCLHMQRTNLLLASPTNELLPTPNSLQLPPIQQQHETFTLQHREQFDDVWLVQRLKYLQPLVKYVLFHIRIQTDVSQRGNRAQCSVLTSFHIRKPVSQLGRHPRPNWEIRCRPYSGNR
ncbi:hypothetical protein MOSE0_K04588 [Monosporozyma servazzii]